LDFGSATFDQVRLSSAGYAFESTHHAYRSVPEPGTLVLSGLGLATGGLTKRRRAN
jgi:hypothetical protein